MLLDDANVFELIEEDGKRGDVLFLLQFNVTILAQSVLNFISIQTMMGIRIQFF